MAIRFSDQASYRNRDYHSFNYLVSELIRQLVQIRIGELTSEEAKGTAWDKNRIFYVGRFGTTENLLKSMAGTLRQAVPKLVNLSPTLAEALTEIERTIQKIQCHLQSNRRPALMPSRRDETEVQFRDALVASTGTPGNDAGIRTGSLFTTQDRIVRTIERPNHSLAILGRRTAIICGSKLFHRYISRCL